MAALWTYIQAHPWTPWTVLFAVALAAFVVMGIYENWAWLKAKLPAIGGPKTPTVVPVAGLTQREAIDSSIALQGYFAARDCPEGIAASEQCLQHACKFYHPVVVVPQVATPVATTTLTVTGPGPLTASQA